MGAYARASGHGCVASRGPRGRPSTRMMTARRRRATAPSPRVPLRPRPWRGGKDDVGRLGRLGFLAREWWGAQVSHRRNDLFFFLSSVLSLSSNHTGYL